MAAAIGNPLQKRSKTPTQQRQTLLVVSKAFFPSARELPFIWIQRNSFFDIRFLATKETLKMKCYKQEDLEAFDLLELPIWVFDYETNFIFWANQSAVHLWNAESMEALTKRSFANMSSTSRRRLEEYSAQLEKVDRVRDSWTFYPNDVGIVTCCTTVSRIQVENGFKPLLFVAEMPTTQESVHKNSMRAVEMLRYQPIPVGMYTAKGRAIHQNPEAVHVFGGREESENAAEAEEENAGSSLLSRFLNREEGQKVLDSVMNEHQDYNDEIQQRTKTGIRWFAVQLRRSMDPVKGVPVILYSARDISTLVEAKSNMEAYAKAKRKAVKASMAKSEFVAVMAHEMRTPLHQVLGFLDLIKGTGLNSQQKEYCSLMELSASSLMAVVNDLLDFTKLEAGKVKMEHIPMDACEVALSSFKLIESQAQQKGLKLVSDIDTSIPRVFGDPSRLRQVLTNFLQNALKFTDKGEISLSVKKLRDDGEGQMILRFAVKDTGIGIRPEHQRIIFDKYQQADTSISRTYGGTGLGLAICTIIVETLGGEIGVDSELSKGSTFWFTLPVERASGETAKKHELHKAQNGRSALHILVAEDNKVNQKLVLSQLKRLGHTSCIVENGAQAVEAVQKEKFDLVLMDVQMPVMDGLKATEEIRNNGWSKEALAIVGLTADYRKADDAKYQDSGMNFCLGKPLRMDELKKQLDLLAS
ncbi:two-component system, sensor histidine kinase and response regulator [Fistulifera solaris]|uniref:Two-component system, sensor histidine kinase and response regulator n=1 Tax=Fistulifera solaris TaxID=1519565 RepID=A0A1Z5K034_FISSO|nr:two-component system, sensor histidine kinase and response regulator [Fistulifera solaris]|eukprot:GAX19519.1 two-component system, sensor histidine kinase and response regulator [Fistulifera solaris]